MRLAAILPVAAIALGLVIGWSTAGVAPPAPQHLPQLPMLRDGHALAGAARERFIALGLAQAPQAEVLPEAPPPPDISVLFRRDLTAIEQTPQGLMAWIIDLDQLSGRRGLKRGDVYQDGWRVSGVTEQSVELRARGQVRRVAVFDLPPEAAQ